MHGAGKWPCTEKGNRLKLKIEGRKQSKKRRKSQWLEECMNVGLSGEDALCQSKGIVDINQITTRIK